MNLINSCNVRLPLLLVLAVDLHGGGWDRVEETHLDDCLASIEGRNGGQRTVDEK